MSHSLYCTAHVKKQPASCIQGCTTISCELQHRTVRHERNLCHPATAQQDKPWCTLAPAFCLKQTCTHIRSCTNADSQKYVLAGTIIPLTQRHLSWPLQLLSPTAKAAHSAGAQHDCQQIPHCSTAQPLSVLLPAHTAVHCTPHCWHMMSSS
jgi:hypothetical protein